MAVVQYSAVVTQLRGKLGGSVFNKSRNAYTLQNKQKQPKGSRGFQSEVRNFFSKYQRTWKSLTPSVRLNWGVAATNNPTRDRFGNPTILSGYNQYIKASMLAEYANAPALSEPYTGAAPANAFIDVYDADSRYTQAVDGNTIIDADYIITTSSASSSWYVILDISEPISEGVTAYHGRWVNVYGGLAKTTGQVAFTTNLGSSFPFPDVYKVRFFRCRLVHIPSGTVVQEVINFTA